MLGPLGTTEISVFLVEKEAKPLLRCKPGLGRDGAGGCQIIYLCRKMYGALRKGAAGAAGAAPGCGAGLGAGSGLWEVRPWAGGPGGAGASAAPAPGGRHGPGCRVCSALLWAPLRRRGPTAQRPAGSCWTPDPPPRCPARCSGTPISSIPKGSRTLCLPYQSPAR